MQFNNLTISGNLVGAPELDVTKNGTEVAQFRIANNLGSQEKRHTNFLDVTVYGKGAENCGKYLAKGDSVLITGTLRIDEYKTRDGDPRKAVIVECNNVQFVKCKAWAESEDEGVTFTPKQSRAKVTEETPF